MLPYYIAVEIEKKQSIWYDIENTLYYHYELKASKCTKGLSYE